MTDWRSWDDLPDNEKQGIAPYCPGGFVAPAFATLTPSDSRTRFTFNNATRSEDDETQLSGDVSIYQQDSTSFADFVTYNELSGESSLSGNVILRQPDQAISSEQALLNLEDYYALLVDSDFVLHQQDIRGNAAELEQQSQSQFVARNLSFTRCVPSSNAWQVRASTLEIDNDEGVARAWNARLEVQKVPVLYTPYISFPLNDQPRTGLLAPTLGSGYLQPYYLALAPNYDDTIAVGYGGDQSLTLSNEFRFLTRNHNGQNEISYQVVTPEDYEDSRWAWAHYQSGQIGWVGYDVATRWVSDRNFDIALNPGATDQIDYQTVDVQFNNQVGAFRNTLDIEYRQPTIDSDEDFTTTDTLATSRLGATQLEMQWQTQEAFETEDDPVSASQFDVIRQPEIRLSHRARNLPLGLSSQASVRYGTLTRDLDSGRESELTDDDSNLATEADRSHVGLTLSRRWQIGPAYVEPLTEGLYTHYLLSNPTNGFDLDAEYGNGEFVHRSARASLDTGLTLEQAGKFSTSRWKPRVYYAYAPLTDSNSPVFESEAIDSFRLYSRSRFSSIDRVGDMSRLSTGVGYELDANAADRRILDARVDKGIKLSQERLNEDGSIDPVDESFEPEFSDWLLQANLYPTEQLTVTGTLDYQHDWSTVTEYSASATYRPNAAGFTQIKGLKDEDDGHELQAGGYWRIADNVALIGYGKLATPTLEPQWSDFDWAEYLVGIDYDSCCWNIRLAALNVIVDDEDDEGSLYPDDNNLTFYFEFTLKGIGTGAGGIEGILNRLDFGYAGRMFSYR